MLLGERLEYPVLAREDDITDIINRIFGESTRSEGSVSDVLGDSVNAIDEFNEDAVEDLLEDSSEAPFIRLVNMILAQAVRARGQRPSTSNPTATFPAYASGWTACSMNAIP